MSLAERRLFSPIGHIAIALLSIGCHQREAPAPPPAPAQPARPPPPAPPAGVTFKGASCNPVGIWRVEDHRSSGATGICAFEGFEGGASNVMITTTAGFNKVRWDEDGTADTTTLGVDDCGISVTVQKKRSFEPPDDGGLGYELTMKLARKLNVSGTVMSGMADVEVTTNPPLKGTPCHAIYDVIGHHL